MVNWLTGLKGIRVVRPKFYNTLRGPCKDKQCKIVGGGRGVSARALEETGVTVAPKLNLY